MTVSHLTEAVQLVKDGAILNSLILFEFDLGLRDGLILKKFAEFSKNSDNSEYIRKSLNLFKF